MRKAIFITKRWINAFLAHESWLTILPALFFLLLAFEFGVMVMSLCFL